MDGTLTDSGNSFVPSGSLNFPDAEPMHLPAAGPPHAMASMAAAPSYTTDAERSESDLRPVDGKVAIDKPLSPFALVAVEPGRENNQSRKVLPGQVVQQSDGANPAITDLQHGPAGPFEPQSRKRSMMEQEDSDFRNKQPRWEAAVTNIGQISADQSPFAALVPGNQTTFASPPVRLQLFSSDVPITNLLSHDDHTTNLHPLDHRLGAARGVPSVNPISKSSRVSCQNGALTSRPSDVGSAGLSKGVSSTVAALPCGIQSHATSPSSSVKKLVDWSYSDPASEDGEWRGNCTMHSTRSPLAASAFDPVMGNRSSSAHQSRPSGSSRFAMSGPGTPATTLGTAPGRPWLARSEPNAAADAAHTEAETGEEAYARRARFNFDSTVPNRPPTAESESNAAPDAVFVAAESGEEAYARRTRLNLKAMERSTASGQVPQSARLISNLMGSSLVPEVVATRASLELQVAGTNTSDFMDLIGCLSVQAMFGKMEHVLRYQLRGAFIDHAYVRFMPDVHDREIGIARGSHHAFSALMRVLATAPTDRDIFMVSVLHIGPLSGLEGSANVTAPLHAPSRPLAAVNHSVSNMSVPSGPRDNGQGKNKKKKHRSRVKQEPLSNVLANQNWRDITYSEAPGYGRFDESLYR